jgi:transposase
MSGNKKTRKRKRKMLGTIRRIPDDLWTEVQPLLPKEKMRGTNGRPVVPFRKVLDGILYVLRTGCQWKALPAEYGSGSTCHRRFQEWVRKGVFQKLWVKLLERYNDLKGIGWEWQSLDSLTVKAPLGGKPRVLIRRIEPSLARRDISSQTREAPRFPF